LYYTIFIRQRSVLFLLRKHTILFLFRKRTVSFRRLDAVEYRCGQGIETGIESSTPVRIAAADGVEEQRASTSAS